MSGVLTSHVRQTPAHTISARTVGRALLLLMLPSIQSGPIEMGSDDFNEVTVLIE